MVKKNQQLWELLNSITLNLKVKDIDDWLKFDGQTSVVDVQMLTTNDVQSLFSNCENSEIQKVSDLNF